jgi:hypothetical protein
MTCAQKSQHLLWIAFKKSSLLNCNCIVSDINARWNCIPVSEFFMTVYRSMQFKTIRRSIDITGLFFRSHALCRWNIIAGYVLVILTFSSKNRYCWPGNACHSSLKWKKCSNVWFMYKEFMTYPIFFAFVPFRVPDGKETDEERLNLICCIFERPCLASNPFWWYKLHPRPPTTVINAQLLNVTDSNGDNFVYNVDVVQMLHRMSRLTCLGPTFEIRNNGLSPQFLKFVLIYFGLESSDL